MVNRGRDYLHFVCDLQILEEIWKRKRDTTNSTEKTKEKRDFKRRKKFSFCSINVRHYAL